MVRTSAARSPASNSWHRRMSRCRSTNPGITSIVPLRHHPRSSRAGPMLARAWQPHSAHGRAASVRCAPRQSAPSVTGSHLARGRLTADATKGGHARTVSAGYAREHEGRYRPTRHQRHPFRHLRGSPTTTLRTRSEMNGGRVAARAPLRAATGISAVRSYRAVRRPDVAEITGAGREWTVSMISELSIPWR